MSRTAVECMLGARSVALVGATERAGSLGERALVELERSPSRPEIHLVNPRYVGSGIGGRPCAASLEELDGPVDLVLFAIGDEHLEAEVARAARSGARSGVIFASVVDDHDTPAFRRRIGEIAREAGMALCGGGCMGFVNNVGGLRALGYLEQSPLPQGNVALITHSGSAFSALLRADRGFGYALAVSSGQELGTTAGEYLDYALGLEQTRVVALLLETLRAPELLLPALGRAAERDIPVVALTVGASDHGRAMVEAHSGALAGSDGAWEALFDAYGVLRVTDLAELCDTVELMSSPRRPAPRGGLAAVLDSGAERALLVDIASSVGVGFAPLSDTTLASLTGLLDPGLRAENPLDVWGRGASTEELFAGSLTTLASDPNVGVVALAVDLVPEYDGDDSYRVAVLKASATTELPMCVLNHVPAALDRDAARLLRTSGIPVLEGTRSGLVAIGHLLGFGSSRRSRPEVRADHERARRAIGLDPLGLLAEYGIASPETRRAGSREEAIATAEAIGFPVVMKTAAPVAHKTEAGGVVLGIASPGEAAEAYDRLAKLGEEVTVARMAPPGVELSLGVVRDPLLGPLVVVGAGGILVELLADRAVALPPIDPPAGRRLLSRLRVSRLLDGYRDQPGADREAVVEAICRFSEIALEIGDSLGALEINPLSCGPSGVLALDVLVERAPAQP